MSTGDADDMAVAVSRVADCGGLDAGGRTASPAVMFDEGAGTSPLWDMDSSSFTTSSLPATDLLPMAWD